MKTLEMPGMEDEDGCDATATVDWKEGGEAFLKAFDQQLKAFNLEVVSWDTGQDTYCWKIQPLS